MVRAMNYNGLSNIHHLLLRMFPLVDKPEDFVVLKADIDGGPKLQIVYEIANCPKLAKLVDEIFFKYHFYFGG